MTTERYLEPHVREDLADKMVFVAGPRQVGKTTLARRILDTAGEGVYLNWDNRDDRREIRAARWPGGRALVVLDELHKWRSWKGWIKGEFDKHRGRLGFLVTGSARLDLHRRGGNSLQGRYRHYRLHPFSTAEALPARRVFETEPETELDIPTHGSQEIVETLMQYGGFPEPFLAQSARTLRRWQTERIDRFIREDVRDLESVRDLNSIQALVDLLPDRIGSPLSLNALREDLEVSHRGLSHWIEILEQLYYLFRLRPFTARSVRGLRKMAKAYLWDSSLLSEPAARFENLTALHLLRLCHYLRDTQGYDTQLHYLRDRTGREVDFLVSIGRKPWFAVEAKLSEARIDPGLVYFRDRLRIPWTYQILLEGTRDFVEDGVRCLPARLFFASLV